MLVRRNWVLRLSDRLVWDVIRIGREQFKVKSSKLKVESSDNEKSWLTGGDEMKRMLVLEKEAP